MKEYRQLTPAEIESLKSQNCVAEDWSRIMVKDGFIAKHVRDVTMSGDIRLGVFDGKKQLSGVSRRVAACIRLHCTMSQWETTALSKISAIS